LKTFLNQKINSKNSHFAKKTLGAKFLKNTNTHNLLFKTFADVGKKIATFCHSSIFNK